MIRRYAIQSTLASARLEGRELPEGYVRTPEVQRYIQSNTKLRKIMTEERAMLERLTQTADKYIYGQGGEPLTGQAKEDARVRLGEAINDAWTVLRP